MLFCAAQSQYYQSSLTVLFRSSASLASLHPNIMFTKSLGQYRFLRAASISSDEDTSGFHDKQPTYTSAPCTECRSCQLIHTSRRPYLSIAAPWVLSFMLSAMCLMLLLRPGKQLCGGFDIFEAGFATDACTCLYSSSHHFTHHRADTLVTISNTANTHPESPISRNAAFHAQWDVMD